MNRTQGLCTVKTLRVSCGQHRLETFPLSVNTVKAHLNNSAHSYAGPDNCTIERQGCECSGFPGTIGCLRSRVFCPAPLYVRKYLFFQDPLLLPSASHGLTLSAAEKPRQRDCLQKGGERAIWSQDPPSLSKLRVVEATVSLQSNKSI